MFKNLLIFCCATAAINSNATAEVISYSGTFGDGQLELPLSPNGGPSDSVFVPATIDFDIDVETTTSELTINQLDINVSAFNATSSGDLGGALSPRPYQLSLAVPEFSFSATGFDTATLMNNSTFVNGSPPSSVGGPVSVTIPSALEIDGGFSFENWQIDFGADSSPAAFVFFGEFDSGSFPEELSFNGLSLVYSLPDAGILEFITSGENVRFDDRGLVGFELNRDPQGSGTNATFLPVPEPSTATLLLFMSGLGFLRRREFNSSLP